MSPIRPSLEVAVILQCVPNTGPSRRWQAWRWELGEVLLQDLGVAAEARLLYKNDSGQGWLHGGFRVELFEDDAEGYFLNASTERPCWFVLWRMDEALAGNDEPIPRPVAVSLSYYDAGRWLDAQETVEQVPAPATVVQWLKAFTDEHYVIEPQHRKRPESFRSLTDRFGNPVSISTGKGFNEGSGGANG
jgi:hypothetical protein